MVEMVRVYLVPDSAGENVVEEPANSQRFGGLETSEEFGEVELQVERETGNLEHAADRFILLALIGVVAAVAGAARRGRPLPAAADVVDSASEALACSVSDWTGVGARRPAATLGTFGDIGRLAADSTAVAAGACLVREAVRETGTGTASADVVSAGAAVGAASFWATRARVVRVMRTGGNRAFDGGGLPRVEAVAVAAAAGGRAVPDAVRLAGTGTAAVVVAVVVVVAVASGVGDGVRLRRFGFREREMAVDPIGGRLAVAAAPRRVTADMALMTERGEVGTDSGDEVAAASGAGEAARLPELRARFGGGSSISTLLSSTGSLCCCCCSSSSFSATSCSDSDVSTVSAAAAALPRRPPVAAPRRVVAAVALPRPLAVRERVDVPVTDSISSALTMLIALALLATLMLLVVLASDASPTSLSSTSDDDSAAAAFLAPRRVGLELNRPEPNLARLTNVASSTKQKITDFVKESVCKTLAKAGKSSPK
ncbi:hypothetical protein GQ42DRAFT_178446 [Ramicandelaber brevisporus]|nr:hypothetical protein GQ42DRAFT_178446 [Ramicandelaber brevisporus]